METIQPKKKKKKKERKKEKRKIESTGKQGLKLQ